MSDDKTVTNLFDHKPQAPKPEPKSQAKGWTIAMTDDEVISVTGHLVLNSMMVAVLEDPDNSFSLKFYAPTDVVKFVSEAAGVTV